MSTCVTPHFGQNKDAVVAAVDSYRPFIMKGSVSLVQGGEEVPVTILRDTGAFDSFIQAGVLPLTNDSDTGDKVPIRGIDMNILLVPLHKVMLKCELFQGEAKLAVRPALPIPGVTVILGNDLVGARVWAEGPPPALVTAIPLVTGEANKSDRNCPEESNESIKVKVSEKAQSVKTSHACRVTDKPKEKLPFVQDEMKPVRGVKAVCRVFSPGDQVLALLPMVISPFHRISKFSGPHKVVKKVSEQSYMISTPNRQNSTQLCNVNLLKKYCYSTRLFSTLQILHLGSVGPFSCHSSLKCFIDISCRGDGLQGGLAFGGTGVGFGNSR